MPNVIVRRPRTEQPQGPVPLRKELYENLLGYFPNSGNDLPTHPLTFAGNAAYGVTEFGRATKFDGSGDYTTAGDAFYSDEYTILVTFNADLLNADPKGIIVKRNIGTGAGTNEIWLVATSTKIEFYAWNGSSTLNLISNFAPVVGQTYTVGIDIPPGTGTAYMYVNGALVGSASKTFVIVNSTSELQFGCMGSGVAARYWNGYIGPAAFWSKRLPNTRELTANPWAILEDERTPVWFNVAGSTAVSKDYTDSYVVKNNAFRDSVDIYSIRNFVAKDSLDSYIIRNSASRDAVDSYLIRNFVAKDSLDTYNVRNNVSKDLADNYVVNSASSIGSGYLDSYQVRNNALNDFVDSYGVRNALNNDFIDSYIVRNSVIRDSIDTYSVRNFVTKDSLDSYIVRNSASRDVVDSYLIRNFVAKDSLDSYNVRNNASKDLSDNYVINSASSIGSGYLDAYQVRNNALNDFVDSYGVRNTLNNDFVDSYSIRNSIIKDLIDSYILRNFVSFNYVDGYNIRNWALKDAIDVYTIKSFVNSDYTDLYLYANSIYLTNAVKEASFSIEIIKTGIFSNNISIDRNF